MGMAQISGTTGADTLVGTGGDDILIPLGTSAAGQRDVLRGLDGADIYDLRRAGSGGVYDFIIDDRGTDGAVDSIINAGALYQSASLGYQDWATALRSGDNLILHLPSRPYRFHSPGAPAYDIRIKDHFGAGTIETIEAGGTTYNLSTTAIGTAVADIMAGNNRADSLSANAGDDWMFGNGGRDRLDAGAGNDYVFAGRGRDSVTAGDGDDRVFGDQGNDRIWLGAGNDRGEGGDGRDVIRGEDGNDWLRGEAGNDRIFGGNGADVLEGGEGDDRLFGGRDGDVYNFSAPDPASGWGHDIIREAANGPSRVHDRISLAGFYGPSSGSSDEAFARLAFLRDGADMVISADDGTSTIRVLDMFGGNWKRGFIEQVEFSAGYWAKPLFQVLAAGRDAIGDDRGQPLYEYGGAANEIIFGSDAGETIFGDAGVNFIWTGAGADTLIYKENDPTLWYDGTYYYGLGDSHDIVQDFDVTQDRLDFTEIASVTSLADLTITAQADGDALIHWDSGRFDVADITIELRGVTQAEVTADLFLFA